MRDLPSLDEFNRFLAKRPRLNRAVLLKAATALTDVFRNPSSFDDGSRMMQGFTFCPPSGSVLLTFPSDWPQTPADRCASLYLMGETVPQHFCDVVRRFHDELETFILGPIAHAGDGG